MGGFRGHLGDELADGGAAAVLVRHAAAAPVMRWRGGRRGRGGGGAGAGGSRRRRRRCGAVSSAGTEYARSAALVACDGRDLAAEGLRAAKMARVALLSLANNNQLAFPPNLGYDEDPRISKGDS